MTKVSYGTKYRESQSSQYRHSITDERECSHLFKSSNRRDRGEFEVPILPRKVSTGQNQRE